MEEFVRKYLVEIITALAGGVLGYLYWYFWGCENSCSIKSVWYKMVLYGLFLGWLLGGILKERFY